MITRIIGLGHPNNPVGVDVDVDFGVDVDFDFGVDIDFDFGVDFGVDVTSPPVKREGLGVGYNITGRCGADPRTRG
jgi:hypothetical protein